MTQPSLIAPNLGELEEMAEQALMSLPPQLAVHTKNLVIQVEDFPDEDVTREMKLESPFDLLGLYSGTDLSQKSITDAAPRMDMVFLYRRPMLDYWCESGEDLNDIVRHVLIHEIGHHFGFSDDEMEALEESSS